MGSAKVPFYDVKRHFRAERVTQRGLESLLSQSESLESLRPPRRDRAWAEGSGGFHRAVDWWPAKPLPWGSATHSVHGEAHSAPSATHFVHGDCTLLPVRRILFTVKRTLLPVRHILFTVIALRKARHTASKSILPSAAPLSSSPERANGL